MGEERQNLDAGEAAEHSPIEEAMLQMQMRQLRDNQNLPAGLVAGFVAAIVGAAVWAASAVITGYQIGLVAIGVGMLVGYAVRAGGRGIDQLFALSGAALALFGCVLGNLLIVCYFVAEGEGIAVAELLPQLDFAVATNLLVATYEPMDLLFYAIAVYEGFQLSTVQAGGSVVPAPAPV